MPLILIIGGVSLKIAKNKLILVKEDEIEYTAKVHNSDDIFDFVKKYIKLYEEPDEVLYLINLTSSNTIQSFMEVARGSSNCCCANMSDILKRVIISNCKKFIILHNHPSGNAKPSALDKIFTEDLKKASQVLGIEFLDHIVIGDNTYKSCMR